jgi:hypothetical protein
MKQISSEELGAASGAANNGLGAEAYSAIGADKDTGVAAAEIAAPVPILRASRRVILLRICFISSRITGTISFDLLRCADNFCKKLM